MAIGDNRYMSLLQQLVPSAVGQHSVLNPASAVAQAAAPVSAGVGGGGGLAGLGGAGSLALSGTGPAAPTSGLTGALARAAGPGGSFLSNRLAGQSTKGLGLRSLAPGSLGRAAGAFGLGQLAGGAIDSAFGDPNASWDNALASGARWGGAGAALGSLVAPGVGTAIGGALGGGFGVVKGLMDAGDEGDKAVQSELSKQQTKIVELLQQLGSSPDLREEAMFQLQMSAANATSKDQVREAATAIQSMLPDAIMQDRQQQEQKRMQEANQAAVQAWMGPMLQQQVDKSQMYADQFAQAGRAAASHITDPALQASQMQMASGISAEQAAMNAAYMQQIATAPSYYGYQNDLLQQIQQAQQQLTATPQGMDMFAQIMQGMG